MKDGYFQIISRKEFIRKTQLEPEIISVFFFLSGKADQAIFFLLYANLRNHWDKQYFSY